MLELLERQQSLTRNQWKIFTVCLSSFLLDFFDFFLIGFVIAFFVSDWHLTYAQSALILLSSGVASIPAAFLSGWLGDKIGRRKVFVMTIIIFSVGTGIMALTPERNWVFLIAMRFIVGLGVGGLTPVALPLLQEFVPASKRGWISGLSSSTVPAGPLLAATLSAFLGPIIGWRGLFAIGLLPALMVFLIRAWVPESPRWLIGQGRIEEARRSLAWALEIDPKEITMPTVLAKPRKSSWLEVFKYPRSIAAGCLTGLSQTAVGGLAAWGIILFVMVLKVTPARASFLAIWVSLSAILGRVFCSWISDALGRRYAGALACLMAATAVSLAGYLHNVYLGAVSMYYVLILMHEFFGNGSLAIVFPYMTELWPVRLRASGFGLVYGTSNLGKFIGPAGLALIAGSSNYVSPKATLAAIVPAFNYFAAWYVIAFLAYLLIGIETRGRTIEELDAAFDKRAPVTVLAR